MPIELPSNPTKTEKAEAVNSFLQEWLGSNSREKEAIANTYFQQIKGFRKVVTTMKGHMEDDYPDLAYYYFLRNTERAIRGGNLLGCVRALSLAFEYRYPNSSSAHVVERLLRELEEYHSIPTSLDYIVNADEAYTLLEDISFMVASVDDDLAYDLRDVVIFLLQDLAKLHINKNESDSISSALAYGFVIKLVTENNPRMLLAEIAWETYFDELGTRIQGVFNRALSQLASRGPAES